MDDIIEDAFYFDDDIPPAQLFTDPYVYLLHPSSLPAQDAFGHTGPFGHRCTQCNEYFILDLDTLEDPPFKLPGFIPSGRYIPL